MVVIAETQFEVRRDGARRQVIVQGAIYGVGVTLSTSADLAAIIQEFSQAHAAWLAETAADPYTILEISRTASNKEIKEAYRKRARVVHPDKHGGDDERMKRLNAAYETLMAAGHP